MEVTQDDEALMRYLKLVIAVAVIRSRPRGLSGQQHAQNLCRQFQKSQLKWKEKAKELELELLLARQRLFHLELQSKSGIPNTISEDVLPTPPSSSEAVTTKSAHNESASVVSLSNRGHVLSQHTSFLQSILAIGAMTDESTWEAVENKTLIIDTIKSALDSVVSFLVEGVGDGNPLINSEVGNLAVDAIRRLADVRVTSGCPVESVRKLILKAVECLCAVLVNNKSLNNSVTQFQICHFQVILSRSAVLREGILWLLLQNVISCGEMLSLSTTNASFIQPELMENVYYVFWCMEQLLCISSVHGTGLSQKFLSEFSDLLGMSLLHLSEDFPLFANYVWHISELVARIQQNEVKACDRNEYNVEVCSSKSALDFYSQ